jgi:hypothetical protein
MRKLLFAYLALAIFSIFIYCGGGGDSSSSDEGTLVIKGASSQLAVPSVPATIIVDAATTTGCDGTDSICCDSSCNCAPTLLEAMAYEVWISENADCSSPILVADSGASPQWQDLVQNPVFFSAPLDPGIYRCLILKISDNLRFIPNQETEDELGSPCTVETNPYTIDIYRSGMNDYWDMETGSYLTGLGDRSNPVAQEVYLFASTDRTTIPNVSTNQAGPLQSTLEITDNQVTDVYLVMDFTNKINYRPDEPDICWLGPPVVDFIID